MKNVCFNETRFEIFQQKSLTTYNIWILKKVGSVFKSESLTVSKLWLRFGFPIVILKYSIWINFSHLLDSLVVIVSRLVVKLVSLRFDDLYMPTTKLFLHIVIFIVKISMSEAISFFIVWLGNWSNIYRILPPKLLLPFL